MLTYLPGIIYMDIKIHNDDIISTCIVIHPVIHVFDVCRHGRAQKQNGSSCWLIGEFSITGINGAVLHQPLACTNIYTLYVGVDIIKLLSDELEKSKSREFND